MTIVEIEATTTRTKSNSNINNKKRRRRKREKIDSIDLDVIEQNHCGVIMIVSISLPLHSIVAFILLCSQLVLVFYLVNRQQFNLILNNTVRDNNNNWRLKERKIRQSIYRSIEEEERIDRRSWWWWWWCFTLVIDSDCFLVKKNQKNLKIVINHNERWQFTYFWLSWIGWMNEYIVQLIRNNGSMFLQHINN